MPANWKRTPAPKQLGCQASCGDLIADEIAPLASHRGLPCTRSSAAAGDRNQPWRLSLTAKAPQAREMSLHLRRASDRYPRACWEPSNDNLVVVSGHTVVGSLKKQIGGTTGERWSWSITCVLVDADESPRIGWAATREEAQQQLAEAWRTWLMRTNLQEI